MSHRLNRRTLGKLSIAPALAYLLNNAEALHAQGTATAQATPQATPSTDMIELPLATIERNPGSENPDADPEAMLTLNLGNEVDSADPAVAYQLSDVDIATKVFAPLLALNENNEVADAGAERVLVSADGLTYHFIIREGDVFSDGTPVTAEHYALGIKRSVNPEVGGNYSSVMYAISGSEAWRTADPADAGTADLAAVVDEAVQAVDERTLQVKLDYAAGYFPYVMCLWIAVPAREDLIGGNEETWWRDITAYVGNGPFKVTEWTEGQQWLLERNDTYFRGAPGVKGIDYRIVTSGETALLAYQQNEFDFVGISASQLPSVEADPRLSAELNRTQAPMTSYIWLNNAVEPFNKKEVRQAFSFAMDRELYIQQIENGVGKPAGSLLYEGIAGYQTEYQQHYDPEQARALLAEAGYENGEAFPPVRFYFGSDSASSQQRATYWAQALLQELNVTVEPSPMDAAQLQSMRTSKDPELLIAFGYWYEDYPHPQNWLTMLLGENSPRKPDGFENQEFFDLLREADTLPIEEATPLYERADAILCEEAPYIFYIHGEDLSLVSPQLQGYVPSPTSVLNTMYQVEKLYLLPE